MQMNYRYSGIANGRVLAEELCTHRIQKLTFKHLIIDLFREDISTLIKINLTGTVYNTWTFDSVLTCILGRYCLLLASTVFYYKSG